MENRPIERSVILSAFHNLTQRYDFIVPEGAGGLAVPLDNDGYMQYDLIRDLGFSCILVSRTTLGTINHTLLTLRYAESLGIRVKGIFMNGFGRSDQEMDNIETIKKLTGLRQSLPYRLCRLSKRISFKWEIFGPSLKNLSISMKLLS
jgi:dethiobiotin synthetase